PPGACPGGSHALYILVRSLAADQPPIIITPAVPIVRIVVSVWAVIVVVVIVARRCRSRDTKAKKPEPDRRANPAAMVTPADIFRRHRSGLAYRLTVRHRQRERRRYRSEEKRAGHAGRKQLVQILTHDPILSVCSRCSQLARSRKREPHRCELRAYLTYRNSELFLSFVVISGSETRPNYCN